MTDVIDSIKSQVPQEYNSYIGDGVYVVFDGYAFWLYTEREGGRHYMCLEPTEIAALQRFVAMILE